MSEEFLTRRQLREREALAGAASEAVPEVTRRELRDRERAIQERLNELNTNSQPQAVKLPESAFPPAAAKPEILAEPDRPVFLDAKPFQDDANPGTIPTQIIRREVSTETNSIVLPSLPAITGSSFTVPQSNIVIHTGAIELPSQPASTTGEIKLVVQPEPEISLTEELVTTDTGKLGVIGIEPVPAMSLGKKKKEKVFPGRLRKGWGTVYLVLSVALIMAAIATGIFLAYAYKLI